MGHAPWHFRPRYVRRRKSLSANVLEIQRPLRGNHIEPLGLDYVGWMMMNSTRSPIGRVWWVPQTGEVVCFLFDTDAVSEMLRPRPAPGYVAWLKAIPRQNLHISTVTIAEMLEGAHRLANRIAMARRIEELVLPRMPISI